MNSANYWKLGAFVLGGLVLAVVTLIWLGAADLSRATRRLVTYFDESVTGLDVGSSVKFRGVSVGTVSEISIASDLRHVRVTSLVYEDVLERLGLSEGQSLQQSKAGTGDSSLRVQLTSTGITGVKFLLIDFYDSRRFPVEKLPFDPGPDYLPSTPSTLKSIEEAAVDVGMQLPELTMRASQTLAAAGRLGRGDPARARPAARARRPDRARCSVSTSGPARSSSGPPRSSSRSSRPRSSRTPPAWCATPPAP